MTRFQGHYKIDWTAVEERKPPETGYYFVCYNNSVSKHSRYSIEMWLNSDNNWVRGTRNLDSIEYWAYLPDLPEGFKEEW